jgi:MYXO-CTERM domain-containing protein
MTMCARVCSRRRPAGLLAGLIAASALGGLAAPASAGFGGQPVLGPLVPGSVVTGNTVGHADDNDGFTSGDHFFFVWDGGDDAYQLDWPGGDLTAQMLYDNSGSVDVDLFLYTPGSLDDSGIYSITNTGFEEVSLLAAPAGTYYLVVDSPAGHEGAYELSVLVPAPGAGAALALLGVAAGAARRRRR